MKRFLLISVLPLFCSSAVSADQDGMRSRQCIASPGRVAHTFGGEVTAGKAYEQKVGPFLFRLRPDDNPNTPASSGWNIGVFEGQRQDDLSQFTTPYRGPNARDVFPWFNANGQLLGIAPGPHRTFYFSPEVGRSIRWEDDAEKRRSNQRRIEGYGRGDFDILEYRVGAASGDTIPPFTWIKFSGCLTWPESK